MDIFLRILDGWKRLFLLITKDLNIYTVIYLLLLLVGIVLVIRIVQNKLKSYQIKQIYKVNRNKKNYLTEITNALKKNRFFRKLADNVAIKIGMFNNYSYEKNLEYATAACFAAIGVIAGSIIVFLPTVKVIWYILLFYIFMAVVFAMLLFYIFTIVSRSRFNNQLPQTFKIINSRYITHGNILKALEVSLGDFDKAVRREMIRVRDLLKMNDMVVIDNTFRMIDRTYRNEYLTLLLNLIKQAHYKGGNEVIKQQIENTTEEILIDIANQKDLSASTRTYIFLSILLLPCVIFVERFNHNALGEKSLDFYSSPTGIAIKVAFLVAGMLYIGMMLFLERTSD